MSLLGLVSLSPLLACFTQLGYDVSEVVTDSPLEVLSHHPGDSRLGRPPQGDSCTDLTPCLKLQQEFVAPLAGASIDLEVAEIDFRASRRTDAAGTIAVDIPEIPSRLVEQGRTHATLRLIESSAELELNLPLDEPSVHVNAGRYYLSQGSEVAGWLAALNAMPPGSEGATRLAPGLFGTARGSSHAHLLP